MKEIPLSIRLTLTNNGPAQATNLSITDLLPAGVTYVSDDGAGGLCSRYRIMDDRNTKQWRNGYLEYYRYGRCGYKW